MEQRRNFLKGFGIMGAVVAISAAARQYQYEQEKPELTDEDIKHLVPENSTHLQLVADNRSIEEKERAIKEKYGDSPYRIMGMDHVTTNRVAMSVGKDDRLWLKIGDKWKRVALDTEV